MNRSLAALLVISTGYVLVNALNTTTVNAQSVDSQLAIEDEVAAETLTRGPLHEAFAEQVNYDPQPGIIVPKAPPEPIDEIPPSVKPEGLGIEWISGYWAWDDERDDFVWLSGVWRDVPPDRRWIPGHWTEVEGGYQWISGFWAVESDDAVEYLPYPPESLERGPTSPAPSVNHYWVSGCWRYQDLRYRWRPGYWNAYNVAWIWVPSRYVWTPRGAIYVAGYWDHPLSRRGVAFAPVYFSGYSNYGYRYQHQYSPTVVINVSHLLSHLFVHPHHHHYYWGDYYGDRYRRAGYQSNFAFHGRYGYDSLFAYYNTQYRRQGIDYRSRLRERHTHLDHDEAGRPPRTWDEQRSRSGRADGSSQLASSVLATSLSEVLKDSPRDMRFRQIDDAQRQSFARSAAALRELSQRRNSTEMKLRASGRADADLDARAEPGRIRPKLELPPRLESPERARPGASRSGRTGVDSLNAPRTRADRGELTSPRVDPTTPRADRVDPTSPRPATDAERPGRPDPSRTQPGERREGSRSAPDPRDFLRSLPGAAERLKRTPESSSDSPPRPAEATRSQPRPSPRVEKPIAPPQANEQRLDSTSPPQARPEFRTPANRPTFRPESTPQSRSTRPAPNLRQNNGTSRPPTSALPSRPQSDAGRQAIDRLGRGSFAPQRSVPQSPAVGRGAPSVPQTQRSQPRPRVESPQPRQFNTPSFRAPNRASQAKPQFRPSSRNEEKRSNKRGPR